MSSGIYGSISPIFFKKVLKRNVNGWMEIFNNKDIQGLKEQYTYKNILILDFECNNLENQKIKLEIIEFPIVLIDGHKNEISKTIFHHYIKPKINPILTDFIKNLTAIKQEQVDNGIIIEEAI